MAQQTNSRLGWRGPLAIGGLISVGCVLIDQVLRNDIPFVVLGAPGLLAGWLVVGILEPDSMGRPGFATDVAFLLVYVMVNAALWAALIMFLWKVRAASTGRL